MLHQKKILFIISCEPYVNSIAQSALDNIFAHASFECTCRIIFTHNGLKQLEPSSYTDQPLTPTTKNISKQIKAMPLYDIDEIYMLGNKPISSVLDKEIKTITNHDMHQLIQTSDMIYHY